MSTIVIVALINILLVDAAAAQIPTIDYTQCSFPYTYNRTVYYNCRQNITGVTDVNNQYGCFQFLANQVNATGAICTGQPEGYTCPVGPDTLSDGSNSYQTTNVCGWYVIMQRYNTTTFNWTQNWDAYKYGFGSPSGTDFWLGLEPMHQLTSSVNYRLRVEVQKYDGRKFGLAWYSGEYTQFNIGDEATKYTINVGGWISDGIAMDSFNPPPAYANATQNGQKFSTYDSDNDNFNGSPSFSNPSCSQVYNGIGWWYSNSSSWCFWNLLSTNYLATNLWAFRQSSTLYDRYSVYSLRLMIKPQ